MQLTVVEVPLEETLDLREHVLSLGHPGRPVLWPYDYDDGARNYGIKGDDGGLIACVSAGPKELDGFEAVKPFRFHSMAVAPQLQRTGIGRAMLSSLMETLASEDVDLAWATARDSALRFYLRCGMQVVEDRKFVVEETGFECSYIYQRLAAQ